MDEQETSKKKLKSIQLTTQDFENTPEVVLAKFENGRLANPDVIKRIEYYSTDNCNLVEPVKKFKRKILVAETDRMKYASANFGPCSTSNYHTCCDYYIGVVNKTTKKLKVMNCEIYNLKPTIAGSIFGLQIKEDKPAVENLTFREKRDGLTASFGSLRSQKAVESRYKHEVYSEDLEGGLKKVIASVDAPDVAKLIPVVTPSTASEAVPPRNADAENVEDVYNINDLISVEERSALEPLATVWAEASTAEIKTWIVQKKYAGFILDCLLGLPIKKEARLEKCILLCYLQYLTILVKMKSTDFRRKDPLPKDMPDLIKKKVLNAYFETTGKTATSGSLRCMTNEKKDKIVADILVLALIANNFRFEYDRLMQDLRTTIKRFQLLITAVGAKMAKTGTGKSAKFSHVTLSLPLAKLELSNRRDQRRRK